jgi:hypothetical protein
MLLATTAAYLPAMALGHVSLSKKSTPEIPSTRQCLLPGSL